MEDVLFAGRRALLGLWAGGGDRDGRRAWHGRLDGYGGRHIDAALGSREITEREVGGRTGYGSGIRRYRPADKPC